MLSKGVLAAAIPVLICNLATRLFADKPAALAQIVQAGPELQQKIAAARDAAKVAQEKATADRAAARKEAEERRKKMLEERAKKQQ
ncbi:MAG: hypothetical protein ACT4QC_01450 [Planctomycetaceae bacterium]